MSSGSSGFDGAPSDPSAREPASLAAQTATGVAWLTMQKWAVRLAGFATIAVLTRLLSPADFGMVAAASTVLPFFYLLADLGFAAYIVQAKEIGQRMLSTGFWYSLGAGILLCGVMLGLAPLLGLAFQTEGVVPVLRALSTWVLITAAASVPAALLRRRMRFATIARQGIAAAVAGQILAVAMALAGLGVWALVGQSLASATVSALLAWTAAKWRPSFAFSRTEFTQMLSFGGKVLSVEFVAMLRAWAEAAIISATLGIAALGYMSIAQRIVQIAQDLTGGALVPVTTVAFAKVRDSAGRLRGAYQRALRATYGLISLPLLFIAVTAPLLLPIVFGPGWGPSYPVAQVLAVAATLTVGASLDHGLFYGLGRPGLWLVYAVVVDATTVAVTAAVAPLGLTAIALGLLGVALVATAGRWYLTPKLLGSSPLAQVRLFGMLLGLGAGSGGVGWLVATATMPLHPLLAVTLTGAAMLAAHLILLRVLARPVYADLWRFLARGLPRTSRMTARCLGLAIALTGLLPPRIRYGYIHPLSRALLRTSVAALPALDAVDAVDAAAGTAAKQRAGTSADVTCVLGAGVLDVGGIGAVVEMLASGLPTHGVTPVVLCLRDDARATRLRASGVEVHVVDDRESAARALRQIRPDVVQLHGAPEFMIDAARESAAPLVTVLHNTEIHYSRRRWRSFAHVLATSSAIAVSESVRAFHAARVPAQLRERIRVVPNAAARPPAPAPDQRRTARMLLERTIGTSLGDDVVFVCLARYDAQKNIAGTVASFCDGLREDDGARLVIAGEPSDWAEYRRADALRRSSAHAERVHLLAASDGPTLLAAADAFLLNSFFEGWPVAATEAWAAGLPLILSDVGGARELVARDPLRSVLVPNPCGPSVTDALVERARRRSRRQRNAAQLAAAVHQVAARARSSPGIRSLPAPDAGSVAAMVGQHAVILRTAAGAAPAAQAGDVRVVESGRGERTA